MALFLNIASTTWLINSDSCIEICAWCGTLSWNGSSWKSIFNLDTHSNIFRSFIRIFQFSRKYCSLPASGKFLISLFEKRFSTKGFTFFNWCIGTISGKCVFGRSEVVFRKVSFFVQKTLNKWSFWLPWWSRLLRWLEWWCWLTSTLLQRSEWYKLHPPPPPPLSFWVALSKGLFVTVICTTIILPWALSLP